MDNVRNDDIGEVDDYAYEIPIRNGEYKEIFESKFKGEEQEEVSIRSTAPQLDDDKLEDERMQEERVEIENEEVTDDDIDDHYSENNYYFRRKLR